MKVEDLATPVFLADMDVLERNIQFMADICREQAIELWPMVKTHKSTQIAALQAEAGARGFLTGTLEEAEGLIECGFADIMLAYPVASRENIRRVAVMATKARVIIGLDGFEAARHLQTELEISGSSIEALLIIDSGLRRFGVLPGEAANLAKRIQRLTQIKIIGIATHPGHVYGAAGPEEVQKAAQEEVIALADAKAVLESQGVHVAIVASGSTPTAPLVASCGVLNVLRPGNYVFYDNIQTALGSASYDQCALSVLATIVSRPRQDLFIIDAGSKCLGLDKGAHGNALINGYGVVKGHPELLVSSLSEEVGKVTILANTGLKVGDKIQIIPNHACAAINMTSWLVGCRGQSVERQIAIDLRGGTRQRAGQ